MPNANTLKMVRLSNYRCFEQHTIELQSKTLIVGKNNAGKSTFIEALRVISIITERMSNLTFKSPPDEFELPVKAKGFKPSLEALNIDKTRLFNRYGAPPALIIAEFTNKSKIEVHIGADLLIHAIIYNQQGKLATNRQQVYLADIPKVSILPQIGPLQENEKPLNENYVKSSIHTIRSSLHFRNQLHVFEKDIPFFKNLVSQTWHGVGVGEYTYPSLISEESISLMIREDDFFAEIAWMGQGIQMWLQTMWFLSRTQNSTVLILDEPDVYMHADIQRKLIRLLLRDKRQFIIATHSPEMMAEVEPESVVVLSRNNEKSKNATSSHAVQELLNNVGSIHNISLAKLGIYKRILLVEGKDIPILKLFQSVIDPSANCPIDAIPNSDIGGWSKWPSVLTMAKFFRRNTDVKIEIFCILDRDYHLDDDVNVRIKEATSAGIHLHIWNSKELESYIVSSSAISRYISKKSGNAVSEENVTAEILRFSEETKDQVIDEFSEEIRRNSNRGKGANVTNPIAREFVNKKWQKIGGPAMVNGKDLFSAIAKWSQDNYHVSINKRAIIREMTPREVPKEVSDLIFKITKISELK